MITIDKNSKEGTLYIETTDFGQKSLSVKTMDGKQIYYIYYCLHFTKNNNVEFEKTHRPHHSKRYYKEFDNLETAEKIYFKYEIYSLKNQKPLFVYIPLRR